MTRVSDRAGFAHAVAEGGGLPFLALAVMRGPEVRALLEETAALLGDRPWGVGVLGFVPPELRDEQLREVQAVRPPIALIAGGRPSQAAPLEADGIRTYLHAPVARPDRQLREGRRPAVRVRGPRVRRPRRARGRASRCGRPRSSGCSPSTTRTGSSCSSPAASTTPARPRRWRPWPRRWPPAAPSVGVLMGTGYLFTEEAVAHGAITAGLPGRGRRPASARSCSRPRPATPPAAPRRPTCGPSPPSAPGWRPPGPRRRRCGPSWRRSTSAGCASPSKGLVREGDALRELGEDELRDEGMFMLGQVASLRHEVTTVEALHDVGQRRGHVAAGRRRRVRRAQAAQVTVREAPARVDVAIVGMAAIMPGAHDVEEFWANIVGRRRLGHRGARLPVGRRPLLRPRRRHQGRRPAHPVEVGRVPAPHRLRRPGLRHPAQVAGRDRRRAAAVAGGRRPRPGRRRLRRPRTSTGRGRR